MKIDIESTPAGFLWILETDSGELIPGKSASWHEVWESCKKLNSPAVEPVIPPPLPVS